MEKLKTAKVIVDEIKALANPQKAKEMNKLFKTGYGEYAEKDKFLGVATPHLKDIAKKYYLITSLSLITRLIHSQYHEIRRTAVEMLALKMEKTTDELLRQKIAVCYLNNIEGINNWDLVDASAYRILGAFLFDKDKTLLYEFASDKDIWKQRISIISTLYFIRKNSFEDTLAISEILMDSKEDLIHKAIGWMLREIGKRDLEMQLRFLDKYAPIMPRTALRYSIEKFDADVRAYYMGLAECKS